MGDIQFSNDSIKARAGSDWPFSGIEHLGACPVCHGSQRSELYKDLVDNVFFCAPGNWTLWRCTKCESAYLDPRPSQDSIHLAYENYYTHLENTQQKEKAAVYSSLNLIRKLRRRLGNGFKNWRYGANIHPASAFGVLAAFLVPGFVMGLDRHYRHLPKLPDGGGSVLDVGCGDCSFLIDAKELGWNVVGLDPDPIVITNAKNYGIVVHQGGIEFFKGQHDLFDVITLSHVIEHVHLPNEVLKICYELLKDNGFLWLETPNIESFGHQRFQKNWRGLETPRHLVLFNKKSLEKAIVEAGFEIVNSLKVPSPISFIYKSSTNMENGKSPYEQQSSLKINRLELFRANIFERIFPSKSEFITFSTVKKKLIK